MRNFLVDEVETADTLSVGTPVISGSLGNALIQGDVLAIAQGNDVNGNASTSDRLYDCPAGLSVVRWSS